MYMVKRWVTSYDRTWIGSKRRIQAIRDGSEGVVSCARVNRKC